MGFRSTFTTYDIDVVWPEWFRDKYSASIAFKDDGTGALHSRVECKTYCVWSELHADIQRAIYWGKLKTSFVLVYLHECGGITRCQIEKDCIKWSEPAEWQKTDGVTHSYCYGCSDI